MITKPLTHHTLTHLSSWLFQHYQPETLEQQLGDELHQHHTWILPQVVAQFRTWQILPDGLDTVRHNCKDPVNQVAWLVMRLPRSKVIPNQVRYPYWAQLTPLFLLGWRDVRTYESWRGYSGLEWLVEPKLWTLMHSELPRLSLEEKLELRQQACWIRTGKQAGTYRNPKSVAKPYHMTHTKLSGLDPLVQCVVLDLWLAHPDLRNQHQILNPNSWDLHPEVLEVGEVFETTPPEGQMATLPWK